MQDGVTLENITVVAKIRTMILVVSVNAPLVPMGKPVMVLVNYTIAHILITRLHGGIVVVIPQRINVQGMIRAHLVWVAVGKSAKPYPDVRLVGVRNMPYATHPMAQLLTR